MARNKKLLIIFFVILLFIGSIIFIGIYDNNESDDIAYIETTSTIKKKVQEKKYIDIKGSVKNPGVYEFKNNDRVIDAIHYAGGLTKNANTTNINLSQKLTSEMVIYVFNNKEINSGSKYSSCSAICEPNIIEVNNCVEESSSNGDKVNINTASMEELMTLTGIGESKAKNIISYREENGKFKVIEDIKNISGIGDALFNKIKDNIVV